MEHQQNLMNKIALITGANSGIGLAIAEQLVQKGLKVVGVSRHVDKIKALAEELKSKPGKLIPLQCDVSNQNEVQRVLEWIENMGGLDILINSAGINIDMTVQNADMEDFKKTIDVNLLGLACMTKEALKLMKKKGIDNGCIININDTCGLKVPMPGERPVSPAYICSKFALTALSECLRCELAQLESNIKVISINPGLVESEMTMQFLKENPRLALKPKDVADAILYALQTPDNVLIKELVITPIREMM